MRKNLLAAAVVAAGLSLTGCSAISNLTSAATTVESVLNTAAGQAFVTALGAGSGVTGQISNVAGTINSINTGVSSPTAQAALKDVCYALPWAQGALDLFGPYIKVSAATISQVDAAVTAFKAGPCVTPPTNLAQVVTEGTQLYQTITSNLKAGGVPVAVPGVAS